MTKAFEPSLPETKDALTSDVGLTPEACEFLQKAQKTSRGRLKLFFGAAPGVGKTYAMLSEAREKRKEGLDVLIGWVDTHGRKDTEALLKGLEVLPRKSIQTPKHTFYEFDIDEVLKRRPPLVIVDELAHTNAPGSRHLKRWQDVEELLESGIDVYSALNVQHLESLNGAIEKLTGVEVRETVPDRLFEEADEVRLVDLPPDDLIERLRLGKVYMRQTIAAALEGFFRKSNLIALRELALRKMALRLAADNDSYQHDESNGSAGGLVLYLKTAVGATQSVRECSQLSYSLQRPWYVVWIDNGRADEDDRRQINDAFRLAEELGAKTQTLESYSVKHALKAFVVSQNIRTIVCEESALDTNLRRYLFEQVASLQLITLQGSQASDFARNKNLKPLKTAAAELFSQSAWWQSLLLTAAVTLLLYLLKAYVDPETLALFYLFPTLLMALLYGTAAATLTATLSALAFDVYFLEPRFEIAIDDFNYVVLLVVMFSVGIGAGSLIAKLKRLSVVAGKRNTQMQTLLALSDDLGKAMSLEEISTAVVNHMKTCGFPVDVQLWECIDRLEVLNPIGGQLKSADRATAAWCVEHCQEAGCGTHTLASSTCFYLPLKGSVRVRGALAFDSTDTQVFQDLEFKRLAQAVADLTASALERVHYVEVSQKALVEMEAQRFRHMLTNELSHDLRTPLTVLAAGAQTLLLQLENHRTIAASDVQSLIDNISRMTQLTDNLLEMARLQSGSVQLNFEWIPVEELFGSAIGALPQALTKDYDIRTEIAPECPYVKVDEILINRLLVNLIDNAIKYCPKESTIILKAKTQADKIVLSVIDNGPGLPADKARLFDPFRRGTKESSVAGIGLGLAICKMIARVHNAQLVAENTPQTGATFSLILPLEEMPESPELDDETAKQKSE